VPKALNVPCACWNTAWIGSHSQWNATKDSYMGVDVLYQRLSGLSTASGFLPVTAFGLTPAANGTALLNNTDVDNCRSGSGFIATSIRDRLIYG
jgi:hypothetical protein